MKSQSTKQLNLRPIYVVVAIGFTVLLVLIWWIGSSSSSKLYEISANARKGTNEYMDRLRLALNIQEAVTEIVAETRVSRARQIIRVPVPPFGAKLKAVDQAACLLPFQPGLDAQRAEGRVIHRGRTTATSEGALRDAGGKLYAHATTTCIIFPVD